MRGLPHFYAGLRNGIAFAACCFGSGLSQISSEWSSTSRRTLVIEPCEAIVIHRPFEFGILLIDWANRHVTDLGPGRRQLEDGKILKVIAQARQVHNPWNCGRPSYPCTRR